VRTRLGAVLLVAVATLASRADAASALSVIAPEIAKGLRPVPANTLVVVSPLKSDAPAPSLDPLAARLASLIAGQLGPTAHASGHPESLSVAQALAAKGGALVYVQAELAHGQLRAAADWYPVLSNGWDRARVSLPAPRAHAFATAPIDAEIRSFLVPVPLERAQVHKARHDLGEVLAVSCGDLDGDGGNELVLVTRTTVASGHIEAGKFIATDSSSWSALAPRVPVPLREPLGTVAIVPRLDESGADLYAGITDRGGVSLSRDLRAAAHLLGLPVLVGQEVQCLKPSPRASAWEGHFFDCATVGRPPLDTRTELPLHHYDALAVSELVDRDGASLALLAARDPSGSLRFRIGDQNGALEAVGAQIAVADLDEDGVAELITTTDAGEDAITISSWRERALVPRLKIPAPSPVRALAVCPPEDAGLRPLVAVVGGEVWIVR
jgi:hypothetical protein